MEMIGNIKDTMNRRSRKTCHYCTVTIGEYMGPNQQIEAEYDSQLMDGDSPQI